MKKQHAVPRLGEIRTVRGFLLRPKTISNETRWLETATWKVKWNGSKYTEIAWVDKKGWFK